MIKKVFGTMLFVSLSLVLSVGAEEAVTEQKLANLEDDSTSTVAVETLSGGGGTFCGCACEVPFGLDELQFVETSGSCSNLIGSRCSTSRGSGTYGHCEEIIF